MDDRWRRVSALQRLGDVSEYGWLVALLATPVGRAFSGSVLTLDVARDNWFGAWPPPDLTRDGQVPTEAREPSPPAR
jgi:citronellol/citronellal dehydrogenase